MANRKIKFYYRQPIPQRLTVGVQGEHMVETIIFTNLPAIDDGQAAIINLVLPGEEAVDAQ